MSVLLRAFHISPDWCGEERIVQLFRMNGYSAACVEDGRLADDLAFTAAAGVEPLQAWPKARAFTGLHRLDRLDRAPVEGWRLFAHLDRHNPDSVFILTTRDPDAWIVDRLIRNGGRTAKVYARHLECAVTDLPDLWLTGWQRHIDAVTGYFGDDPRLIRIDLETQTPDDLCDRLAPWFALPNRPRANTWMMAPDRMQVESAFHLLDTAPPVVMPTASADRQFVDDVVSFCLQGLAPTGDAIKGASALYGYWDGGQAPTRRDGSDWPVAVGASFVDPPSPRAFAAPGIPKLSRLEGVMNDILSLGRHDPVHIDMEDSRWFGSAEGHPIEVPILCHNRRQGARNAVLWPLPGYHGVGLPGFATAETADTLPWEAKQDRVVWRGNLSGGVNRPGIPRPVEAAHSVLARLEAAGDDAAARDAIGADLAAIPRLDFVRRFVAHPDFDVGLVMAAAYRRFGKDAFLTPVVKPRLSPTQFHRFRYQLSLAGYDHPTNFIGAINARSVLLKEEDGWEVYYSGRFLPWVHYIPLERHAADIEEKLAWARAHQYECRAMSQSARGEVAFLADRTAQRQIMVGILDRIAAGNTGTEKG